MENPSIPGLPSALYSWLLQSGLKPSTARLYKHQLSFLFSKKVKLDTPSNALAHIESLKLKGISSSQINNCVGCMRVYARYCRAIGKPHDPIIAEIPFVKDKYRPRATMSDQEIEQLLALPRQQNTGHITHEYWTVYFSILAYTGMRTGEVAKLRVQDVDFSQGIFYLIDTKTNDNRLVPIPVNIKERVLKWANFVKKGQLFYAKRPGGYTSNSEWHYQFHKRVKILGINRPNLTPYSLRHSYITEMLQTDGVNIFDVKNLVGHHDTRTTENYYHLTTKRLKRVSAKHPGVRKYTSPKEIFALIEEFVESLGLGDGYAVTKTVSPEKLLVNVELVKT